MVQKRRNTAVRQGQILNAARKVIVKYGSEHVTVKRIAKEVGISEAAVYRHFTSKRAILSSLADQIEELLLGDLEAEVAASGGTALETLDRVLRNHLSAVEQRRGISFLVIAEIISLGDKKLNGKMSDIISKYSNRIADLISQGVKAGEVRKDTDPEVAATVFFGTIQALVDSWHLSNYSFDLEDKYVHYWEFLRSALVRR